MVLSRPPTEKPRLTERERFPRWDAWTAWENYRAFLQPEEWHNWLPFYAEIQEDGNVEVRGDRMEVMNQEIDSAHTAGIDYWAWRWYDPTTEEGTEYHMNNCLDLYRCSLKRNMVNHLPHRPPATWR